MGVDIGGLFDTLLASQLVSAGDIEERHGLEAIAGRYLNEVTNEIRAIARFMRDAVAADADEMDKIDKEVVDPNDVETLQDLVLAAFTDALKKSRELAAQRLGGVTGGLKIPGM